MNVKLTETAWLDAHCEVSFAKLAQLSGLARCARNRRSELPRVLL